jgi:hypothetical protein
MSEIPKKSDQSNADNNNTSHIAVVVGLKWISVKDKLPDCIHIVKNSSAGVDKYSDTVLAWCNDKLMVLSLQYGFFGENGEYGYIWCNHFGDITNDDPEWDDSYEPTHWMPLPKYPLSEAIAFEPTDEQIEKASIEYAKEFKFIGWTELTIQDRAAIYAKHFRGVQKKLKESV